MDGMICGDGGFVLPPRPSSVLSPPVVAPSSFNTAAVPLQRSTIMHPNKIDTKKGSFGMLIQVFFSIFFSVRVDFIMKSAVFKLFLYSEFEKHLREHENVINANLF